MDSPFINDGPCGHVIFHGPESLTLSDPEVSLEMFWEIGDSLLQIAWSYSKMLMNFVAWFSSGLTRNSTWNCFPSTATFMSLEWHWSLPFFWACYLLLTYSSQMWAISAAFTWPSQLNNCYSTGLVLGFLQFLCSHSSAIWGTGDITHLWV